MRLRLKNGSGNSVRRRDAFRTRSPNELSERTSEFSVGSCSDYSPFRGVLDSVRLIDLASNRGNHRNSHNANASVNASYWRASTPLREKQERIRRNRVGFSELVSYF